MKYNSALISEGRNKLGDSVFSRNPSGNYIRARVKPTNPQTVLQQAWRANFSMLSKRWRTLTADQIAGWNLTATQVTKHDTLGQAYHPTGIDLFISCNLNIIACSQPPISDPPANTIIPAGRVMTQLNEITYVDGGALIEVLIEDFAGEAENQLVGYITGGFSPGITFVPPFFYRTTQFPPESGETFIQFGIEGPPSWPGWADGNKLGLATRTINAFTGFASKLNTIAITIYGTP
jgi:hypothetical protein